jgi:hypothetical protein
VVALTVVAILPLEPNRLILRARRIVLIVADADPAIELSRAHMLNR